jgi:hypothetical protein
MLVERRLSTWVDIRRAGRAAAEAVNSASRLAGAETFSGGEALGCGRPGGGGSHRCPASFVSQRHNVTRWGRCPSLTVT